MLKIEGNFDINPDAKIEYSGCVQEAKYPIFAFIENKWCEPSYVCLSYKYLFSFIFFLQFC